MTALAEESSKSKVGELLFEWFIKGTPYARTKSKGRLGAPKQWTDEIVRQTMEASRISEPCSLDVEFVLPVNKYPQDLPFGMDLDNLLKRLLDGLGQTVLGTVKGGDSAIVAIHASKRPARRGEVTGARIVFRVAEFTPPDPGDSDKE